jgi:tetratricopeptide (TPR) repeat protein
MDNKTSEIAKLTERISRDPKSKLFVPLAEEYKKAGDINMAIHVLTEGLKNNPGYVTARSFLGKLLIEKGDLPAAQKEFEEVVRAIPDNLMAQRKLADLYALQDRTTDAAAHYKIALTLNPKDAETAELLAEVEAGREIKSRLRGTKPAETPEQKPQAAVKPAAPASAAPSQPTPAAKPSEETQKPVTATAPAFEEEVAEEILVVEPLEPSESPALSVSSEQPSPEAAPSEIEIPDFLSESQAESEPPTQVEDQADEDVFSLNEPFVALKDSGAEPSQPEEALPDIFAEEPVAAESTEAPAPSGLFEEEQTRTESLEKAGKEADDFTTDTLAELYISQGFFEKAVDIYERMLVDNPNSQGLKDKLANVRAMAAASTAEESDREVVESEIVEAEIIEEPLPGGPEPVETEQPSVQTESLTSQVPEQVHPRLDDWELPATKAVPSEDSERPAKPRMQPKQFDVGFEPREYIPPDAVPVGHQASDRSEGTSGEKSVDQTVKPPISSRKLTPASKKETVERLEKWLKNIRKEN